MADDFAGVVGNIVRVLNSIVYIIVALALVAFLYGLVSYLANGGDEEKRKESVSYMIAGIIGLFVMVSVWGLLALLTNTFDVSLGIPQLR